MSANYDSIMVGDPAPWFQAACTSNEEYTFYTVGGRYVVLCFFATANSPHGAAALTAVSQNRDLFDDEFACFFGVSIDPTDRDTGRVRESLPGIRHFWDFDGAISKAFGALRREASSCRGEPFRQSWVVLDPNLRVIQVFPFLKDGSDRAAVFSFLRALPPPEMHAGVALQAPILLLPNVFELDFCRELIALYEANESSESGFMREIGGKTVQVVDHSHKRRRDYDIEDDDVVRATKARVLRRVVPEIRKAYQFPVSRMERFIVACYSAGDGGHFRAHRDNTTRGTAHRRFAISINLNADFDGGEVSFPEYGPRAFKAPPGAAVVFSCSLLHQVSKVTRGKRYAFLPFVYDDEAAKLRMENNRFLDESVGRYDEA